MPKTANRILGIFFWKLVVKNVLKLTEKLFNKLLMNWKNHENLKYRYPSITTCPMAS